MNYTLVFSSLHTNALVTDILIKVSYDKLDNKLSAIFIVENDMWQMHFPDNLFPKFKEIGYSNCFDNEFLSEYKKNAKAVVKRLEDFIKKKEKIAAFDVKQYSKFFKEFINAITDFLKLYKMTEFFYFGKLEKELFAWNKPKIVSELLSGKEIKSVPDRVKRIAEFIEEMQAIKFRLREKINKAYFGKDSIFLTLASAFEKLTSRKDFLFLNIDEINKILSGERAPIMEERKDLLAVFKENNKWRFETGKQANKIIAKIKPKLQTVSELKGQIAGPGRAVVVARVYPFGETYKFNNMKKRDILVASRTGPEFMTAIQKARAIVTDEGGLMSHAAVVSRELKIPCIVGTKFATQVLKDGDLVEVNVNHGLITVLERTDKT